MVIPEIKPLYKKIAIFAVVLYSMALVIYGTSKFFDHHQKILYSYIDKEGYGYNYINYFNSINIIKAVEPFNIPDFFTASFLFLAGITSFLVFFLLSYHPSRIQFKKLCLLFCAGFFYLGSDELFQIHETVGLNVAHLLYSNLVGARLVDESLDSSMIILYAIAALAVILINRRFFLCNWMGFCFLIVGGIFQSAATVIDFFWNRLQILKTLMGVFSFVVYHDEYFEMNAAFCYFIAILIYSFTLLSKYYEYRDGNIVLISTSQREKGVLRRRIIDSNKK